MLSEIHLRKYTALGKMKCPTSIREFTYGASGIFTEEKETGGSRYICSNELYKPFFQHGMV